MVVYLDWLQVAYAGWLAAVRRAAFTGERTQRSRMRKSFLGGSDGDHLRTQY